MKESGRESERESDSDVVADALVVSSPVASAAPI